tara:strand:- start:4062 stop:5615 length:1554 start_codon:yes stop_codon:yes gene_type:complete
MGHQIWKIAFPFLFLLILVNISLSDNTSCDYTKTEKYYETEKALVYLNSELKGGEDLIFSGFSEGQYASFVIQNPNPFRLMVILNYTLEGTVTKNTSYGKWINAEDEVQILDVCRDGEIYGNCSINKDSVVYQVHKPDIMNPAEIEVEKTKNVCDGKNNGSKCANGSECGSRKCNFAGFCGEFTHCPEGTTNCQDTSCLVPSTKEVGESYLCDWECKSQVGEGGVCVENIGMKIEKVESKFKEWVILISISLFAILVIVIKIIHTKETKLGVLSKEISEKQKDIRKINLGIDDLKKSRLKLEMEGERLKEKIKNSAGEAKKKFEEELRRFEIENKHTINEINEGIERRKNELRDEYRDIERKKKEQRDELKRLKEKDGEIKARYEKYDEFYIRELEARYGKDNFEINGDGYPVFSDKGKNSDRKKSIHRFFYKEQFKDRYGYEFDQSKVVHHIDANRKNSLDFSNLIDLNRDKHDLISHTRINRGDWKKGIEVMMDCLNWTEDDFPEHIRERLKKKN